MEGVKVRAVGTAVGRKGPLAEAIQSAMVAAIEACLAQGITDPDVIRQAQLDARETVKRLLSEQEAQ